MTLVILDLCGKWCVNPYKDEPSFFGHKRTPLLSKDERERKRERQRETEKERHAETKKGARTLKRGKSGKKREEEKNIRNNTST